VNLWNSLPQRAVEAKSLSVFKAEINRLLINQGLWGKGRRIGLRKISAVIEWQSGLDGPSGLISTPMSYGIGMRVPGIRVQAADGLTISDGAI